MDDCKTDLRDMLSRDFALDLEISGGFGRSSDEPIIIKTPDPLKASTTEMQTIRGICRGRQVLWRTLSRLPIERDGKRLEQVKLETKELTSTEIITQRENYYFDIAIADPDHHGLPAVPGYIDRQSGIKLPYEVGWLHLEKVISNEAVAPGLGHSVVYAALGMKATVYVYDRGIAQIPPSVDSDISRAEFLAAVLDMKRVNPQAQPVRPIIADGFMLRQDFQNGNEFTVIGLAVSRARFVKFRLTTIQDPVVVASAEQSVEALHGAVRPN